ncbi:hypothetical protein D3C71_1572560 [compost metagenome]
MAHEHAVEHLAAGLGRLLRFQTLAGAGQIRAAVLEHAGTEHHAVALRRDAVAVHIGGEIGQLARRATGQRHGVQLLAAVLGAEEVDALAIGGDRSRVDVPAFRRELTRRRQVAGTQIADPQAAAGLQLSVDHALGEHHLATIGGQQRRGRAVQLHHVADFKTARTGQ